MLRVTTQKWIRHEIHPLHHRYIIDHIQLNRNPLNVQFYTDHLLSKAKSLEGNTGVWIYTTGKFTVTYSCKHYSEVGYILCRFARNAGIPYILRSDLAPEKMGKIWSFRPK